MKKLTSLGKNFQKENLFRYVINKIINGCCLEHLPKIKDKSIDFICCDLPYNVSNAKWDKEIIPLDILWSEYRRIIKPMGVVALFSSGLFTHKLVLSNPKMYKYEWYWIKNRSAGFLNAYHQPLRNVESIIIYYNRTKDKPTYNPQYREGKPYTKKENRTRKTTDLYNKYYYSEINNIGFRFPQQTLNFKKELSSIHPTQKPVELLKFLIKTYTNEQEIVLDNCSGSGSLAVACLETNRKFICIEKEKSFFDLSQKRIKNTIKDIKNKLLINY